MRHFIIGAAMLVVALIVTFGAASVLQGIAVANRTVSAEPFTLDRIGPDVNADRRPRSEPAAGRARLANRHMAGV
jgi:hypothetical protein